MIRRRPIVCAGLMGAALVAAPGVADAKRAPTDVERAAIPTVVADELGSPAFGEQRVGDGCWQIAVSTADETFARARVPVRDGCRIEPDDVFWLLRRAGESWETDLLGSGTPCYREAPAERRAIVVDLWGEAGCAPEPAGLELDGAAASLALTGPTVTASVQLACDVDCTVRVAARITGAAEPVLLGPRTVRLCSAQRLCAGTVSYGFGGRRAGASGRGSRSSSSRPPASAATARSRCGSRPGAPSARSHD